jgi:hypothetical protein
MRVAGTFLIIFTIRKYDLAVIRNDTTAPTPKISSQRLIRFMIPPLSPTNTPSIGIDSAYESANAFTITVKGGFTFPGSDIFINGSIRQTRVPTRNATRFNLKNVVLLITSIKNR